MALLEEENDVALLEEENDVAPASLVTGQVDMENSKRWFHLNH